jgi:hypothetical protein
MWQYLSVWRVHDQRAWKRSENWLQRGGISSRQCRGISYNSSANRSMLLGSCQSRQEAEVVFVFFYGMINETLGFVWQIMAAWRYSLFLGERDMTNLSFFGYSLSVFPWWTKVKNKANNGEISSDAWVPHWGPIRLKKLHFTFCVKQRCSLGPDKTPHKKTIGKTNERISPTGIWIRWHVTRFDPFNSPHHGLTLKQYLIL